MSNPWEREGDHHEFEHDGSPCVVHRTSFILTLCGYVGVPEGHPWFGKRYNDCLLPDAKPIGPQDGNEDFSDLWRARCEARLVCDENFCQHCPEDHVTVHGGLTYSEDKAPCSDKAGYWWFGFDTAHGCDYCPGMSLGEVGDYRDVTFVREEVKRLVAQLQAIAKVPA